MSFKGYRSRKPYRMENKREAHPESWVTQGSEGALPKQIDLQANMLNKHYKWGILKKEYIRVFTEKYDYFQDIIINNAHHDFGPKPMMTVEENQAVLDIVVSANIAEMVWQTANPDKLEEFREHGAAAREYARLLTASERESLNESIRQRRIRWDKEQADYLKAYPKVFEFLLSRCSSNLIAKLSINEGWSEQVSKT
jgi:hypothetical protein